MKKYKVNLLIDSVTHKIYDVHTIDSIGRAGGIIALAEELPSRHDTGYWKFFFADPFIQTNRFLYKKYMGNDFTPFVMSDLSGRTVNSASFKGKIVLLNFWSTTCGPCIAEMPLLNRLVDSLKDGPYVFIAPAYDDSADVANFLKKYPFKYNVIPGAKSFADAIGVSGYPTNIVINKSGKVVSVIEGVNLDSLTRRLLVRDEIDSILKIISK